MTLPMLAHDKANHWVYGSLVAMFGLLIDAPTAIAFTIIVGGVREGIAWFTGIGEASPYDFVCTLAGGATVFGPAMLKEYL